MLRSRKKDGDEKWKCVPLNCFEKGHFVCCFIPLCCLPNNLMRARVCVCVCQYTTIMAAQRQNNKYGIACCNAEIQKVWSSCSHVQSSKPSSFQLPVLFISD